MPPRHHLTKWAIAAIIAAALVFFLLPRSASQEFSSFASVYEDGSLNVGGRRVFLYGIYVPPTAQSCQFAVRPVECGSRAQLALNFLIEGEFVHCIPRAIHQDGSMTASCWVPGADLSEWMLQRGWAMALPDAPFAYVAMERIAQTRGIGIWGIPVDIIRR